MKYVFIGPNSAATIVLVRDLFLEDEILYVENPSIISDTFFKKYFIKILYRTEFFMNGVVSRMLVKIFCSRKMFSVAHNNKDSIFVYFHPWINTIVDSGIITKIKKNFPDIKHVAMFYDIQIMKRHNLQKMKNYYDLLATYDETEAKKAGISFIPPVYSQNNKEVTNQNEQYDLSFVGKAKDRYEMLLAVYDYLENNNISCHFFIFGVPKSKQAMRSGIIYGNKEISPDEADQFIESSRCILDLSPYGTSALTSRHREAIIYGKKLLSNNCSIMCDKYYGTGNMQYFNRVEDIDISFFGKETKEYNYKGEFKASNFINELEVLISGL